MTDLCIARNREGEFYNEREDAEYEEEEDRADKSEEGEQESDYEVEDIIAASGKELVQIKEDYVMYKSDE